LGISNLAAVAQQFAMDLAGVRSCTATSGFVATVDSDERNDMAVQDLTPAPLIAVCMDARMGEVYWATFRLGATGEVVLAGEERVDRPEAVVLDTGSTVLGVGTGFRAYPVLRERYPTLQIHDGALPHAREIAVMAESRLLAGEGVGAGAARPVYIRDKVVN